MSDETNSNMTTFDSVIQTKQLQIIKAAIPYIQTTEQKFLSIYVKYLELNQTINLFNKKEDALKMCSVDSESDSPNEKPIRMLNDIRNYCSDTEKETIDMILNFFNAFEIYNSYLKKQGDGTGKSESPLSFFKNFMTPEQKEVFETYKTQFT
ncbi:hypothetical protein [Anaerosacchariphilus polymeriproducens]|uniref:Uncharacterized protein n=1 Tax=Anaerosacchariphilus polymeriproducens TaxID=1812858 RepID=A0A371ATX3_9FIRM|nr:hypothetical protein [Anaerosacchariphilus polymeriproducens]RDU22999.1 hypothetical protein DWV06_11570 [Anaerosacchariphilus polymeriproducens]